MATNFSPCKRSYVLNQFPSNVMFGMNVFHVSARGAIQGHHCPIVMLICQTEFIIQAILTELGAFFMKSVVSKMTLKYMHVRYIHDAEMEKFILTRLCQFGGHQIRNSANLLTILVLLGKSRQGFFESLLGTG